jgi:hypothetical protein
MAGSVLGVERGRFIVAEGDDDSAVSPQASVAVGLAPVGVRRDGGPLPSISEQKSASARTIKSNMTGIRHIANFTVRQSDRWC